MSMALRLREWRDLPYGRSRPLVFHVLTRQPDGDRGLQVFRDLVRQGAALAPAGSRDDCWARGGCGGALFEDDTRAGDDRFLFFKTGAPYGGERRTILPAGLGYLAHPAVAFDLEDLFDAGRVGWRVVDIAGMFPTLKARRVPLREFTERFTVWRPETVRHLCRTECDLLAGMPDLPALEAAIDGVARILERHLRPDDPVLGEMRERLDPVGLAAALTSGYGGLRPGFDEGTSAEVLLEGSLPLSMAEFYLDGQAGRWRPMEDLFHG
jgi:hypothetical protein